ncbi:hypothetical protein AB0L13_21280, partial [Saccharopolyspora shandongensis]|uniref:helix-turn-helix domain-containing protein n=1 Tax=Saccharopolyspora shandongensis TaxID=418495 RepID=UPI00341D9C0A
MSLYLDPEGAKVFAGLTGSEWPEADEDKLKDLDGEYKAAAEALRSLQRHLNDYVAAINAGFAGDAAEEFGQYARQYITSDESGLSTLEKVAAAADSFGDFLFQTSSQVRYMKAQAIGQMILMAIEIAGAIAMAWATGGASLLKIPIIRAITSTILRLLVQLIVATIMSLAFELVAGWLLDLAIQSELIKQGLQHGWNQDLTTGALKGAAVSGSIGGVASMAAGALGKTAIKHLGKTLAKFNLTSEFSKKLLNVGDHAADSITKQFGKSASDTGTTALSKSVTETSTSTTGSLSKSTTDNLAGSLPKLGDDLAAATKNFSTHFLTGFGNGASHGIGKGGLQSLTASAGFRFKEAVSTAFEKHLTGALGKEGAKSAGEAFGEAVTKNAGKTGQGGFELGLATAMHPYRKELGENAFNALTKGYSDSIHSGLSHVKESVASHMIGSAAGSPIFGLQGFLGDGAGSAVNGEEWDPSWESFTGGAVSGAAEMLGETLVADKVKEQLLQNNLTIPLMMKNFFDSGGTSLIGPIDPGVGGASGPGSAISTESSSFSDSSSTFSDSSTVVDHGGTGSLDTLESAANIETQPLLGDYGDWMSDTGSDYGESHFDDVPDLIDLDAELDPVTGEPLPGSGPNGDHQVAFSPGALTSPNSMTTSTGPTPAVTSTSTTANPQNPGAQPNAGQRNTGQQNPVSQVTESTPMSSPGITGDNSGGSETSPLLGDDQVQQNWQDAHNGRNDQHGYGHFPVPITTTSSSTTSTTITPTSTGSSISSGSTLVTGPEHLLTPDVRPLTESSPNLLDTSDSAPSDELHHDERNDTTRSDDHPVQHPSGKIDTQTGLHPGDNRPSTPNATHDDPGHPNELVTSSQQDESKLDDEPTRRAPSDQQQDDTERPDLAHDLDSTAYEALDDDLGARDEREARARFETPVDPYVGIDIDAEAQRVSAALTEAASDNPTVPPGLLEPDLFGSLQAKQAPSFLPSQSYGPNYEHLSTEQGIELLEKLDLARPADDLNSAALTPQALTGSTVPMTKHTPANSASAPGWVRGVHPLDKIEMPHVRHSIWLGGPITDMRDSTRGKQQMLQNLQASAQELGENGRVVLWTDVPREKFADPNALEVQLLSDWAREHGVILVNVHEVFNSDSPMKLQAPFQAELMKGTKAGYAAASDILRMELLKRFGGVYSDGEYVTGQKFFPEAAETVTTEAGYGVHVHAPNGLLNAKAGNDLFVVPKGHPFADAYLDHLAENYRKAQSELIPEFQQQLDREDGAGLYHGNSPVKARRHSVMYRTGPENLSEIAKQLGLAGFRELPPAPLQQVTSGSSWTGTDLPSPRIGIEDRAATVDLTKQVVQTLVRELHNRDGDLHLTLVQELVAKHRRPDVIWTAALDFLASRPELASMVTRVTDTTTVSDDDAEVGYTKRPVNLPDSALRYLKFAPEGETTHSLGEFSKLASMVLSDLGTPAAQVTSDSTSDNSSTNQLPLPTEHRPRGSIDANGIKNALRHEIPSDWQDHADPHADRLGHDPFGVRKPPPAPDFLQHGGKGYDYGKLHADKRSAFFERLDMVAGKRPTWESPQPENLASRADSVTTGTITGRNGGFGWKTQKIPNLVHHIWLGGPLHDDGGPRAEFMANVAEAATNPDLAGFKFQVFTDVSRADFERVAGLESPEGRDGQIKQMLDWAKANGIRLINVDEVFNEHNPMKLDAEVRTERARGSGAAYATASDMLRVEILDRFGGVYNDGDNRVVGELAGAVRKAAQHKQGFLLGQDDRGRLSNSAIVSAAGTRPTREYLKILGENYAREINEVLAMIQGNPAFVERVRHFTVDERRMAWRSDDFGGNEDNVRSETICRTGPNAVTFKKLASALGYGSVRDFEVQRKLPALDLGVIETGTAHSWLEQRDGSAGEQAPRAVPAGPQAVVDAVRHAVVSLHRELPNRGNYLHLPAAERTIAKLPAEDRPAAWAAALELFHETLPPGTEIVASQTGYDRLPFGAKALLRDLFPDAGYPDPQPSENQPFDQETEFRQHAGTLLDNDWMEPYSQPLRPEDWRNQRDSARYVTVRHTARDALLDVKPGSPARTRYSLRDIQRKIATHQTQDLELKEAIQRGIKKELVGHIGKAVRGEIGYDLREFRVIDEANGVPRERVVKELTHKVHLEGDAELREAVKAGTKEGLDRLVNKHGFRLPTGEQLHLRLEFVDDPAAAHNTAELWTHKQAEKLGKFTDQHNWVVRDAASGGVQWNLVHELLHSFGLVDEYLYARHHSDIAPPVFNADEPYRPKPIPTDADEHKGRPAPEPQHRVHDARHNIMGARPGTDPGFRPRHAFQIALLAEQLGANRLLANPNTPNGFVVQSELAGEGTGHYSEALSQLLVKELDESTTGDHSNPFGLDPVRETGEPRPEPTIRAADWKATVELTKQVVHTLVSDLRRNGDLHLTAADQLVAWHYHPDAIWTAALGYLSSRPELAGMVRQVTDTTVVRPSSKVTPNPAKPFVERQVRLPERARSYLRIDEDAEPAKSGGESWRSATMVATEHKPTESNTSTHQDGKPRRVPELEILETIQEETPEQLERENRRDQSEFDWEIPEEFARPSSQIDADELSPLDRLANLKTHAELRDLLVEHGLEQHGQHVDTSLLDQLKPLPADPRIDKKLPLAPNRFSDQVPVQLYVDKILPERWRLRSINGLEPGPREGVTREQDATRWANRIIRHTPLGDLSETATNQLRDELTKLFANKGGYGAMQDFAQGMDFLLATGATTADGKPEYRNLHLRLAVRRDSIAELDPKTEGLGKVEQKNVTEQFKKTEWSEESGARKQVSVSFGAIPTVAGFVSASPQATWTKEVFKKIGQRITSSFDRSVKLSGAKNVFVADFEMRSTLDGRDGGDGQEGNWHFGQVEFLVPKNDLVPLEDAQRVVAKLESAGDSGVRSPADTTGATGKEPVRLSAKAANYIAAVPTSSLGDIRGLVLRGLPDFVAGNSVLRKSFATSLSSSLLTAGGVDALVHGMTIEHSAVNELRRPGRFAIKPDLDPDSAAVHIRPELVNFEVVGETRARVGIDHRVAFEGLNEHTIGDGAEAGIRFRWLGNIVSFVTGGKGPAQLGADGQISVGKSSKYLVTDKVPTSLKQKSGIETDLVQIRLDLKHHVSLSSHENGAKHGTGASEAEYLGATQGSAYVYVTKEDLQSLQEELGANLGHSVHPSPAPEPVSKLSREAKEELGSILDNGGLLSDLTRLKGVHEFRERMRQTILDRFRREGIELDEAAQLAIDLQLGDLSSDKLADAFTEYAHRLGDESFAQPYKVTVDAGTRRFEINVSAVLSEVVAKHDEEKTVITGTRSAGASVRRRMKYSFSFGFNLAAYGRVAMSQGGFLKTVYPGGSLGAKLKFESSKHTGHLHSAGREDKVNGTGKAIRIDRAVTFTADIREIKHRDRSERWSKFHARRPSSLAEMFRPEESTGLGRVTVDGTARYLAAEALTKLAPKLDPGDRKVLFGPELRKHVNGGRVDLGEPMPAVGLILYAKNLRPMLNEEYAVLQDEVRGRSSSNPFYKRSDHLIQLEQKQYETLLQGMLHGDQRITDGPQGRRIKHDGVISSRLKPYNARHVGTIPADNGSWKQATTNESAAHFAKSEAGAGGIAGMLNTGLVEGNIERSYQAEKTRRDTIAAVGKQTAAASSGPIHLYLVDLLVENRFDSWLHLNGEPNTNLGDVRQQMRQGLIPNSAIIAVPEDARQANGLPGPDDFEAPEIKHEKPAPESALRSLGHALGKDVKVVGFKPTGGVDVSVRSRDFDPLLQRRGDDLVDWAQRVVASANPDLMLGWNPATSSPPPATSAVQLLDALRNPGAVRQILDGGWSVTIPNGNEHYLVKLTAKPADDPSRIVHDQPLKGGSSEISANLTGENQINRLVKTTLGANFGAIAPAGGANLRPGISFGVDNAHGIEAGNAEQHTFQRRSRAGEAARFLQDVVLAAEVHKVKIPANMAATAINAKPSSVEVIRRATFNAQVLLEMPEALVGSGSNAAPRGRFVGTAGAGELLREVPPEVLRSLSFELAKVVPGDAAAKLAEAIAKAPNDGRFADSGLRAWFAEGTHHYETLKTVLSSPVLGANVESFVIDENGYRFDLMVRGPLDQQISVRVKMRLFSPEFMTAWEVPTWQQKHAMQLSEDLGHTTERAYQGGGSGTLANTPVIGAGDGRGTSRNAAREGTQTITKTEANERRQDPADTRRNRYDAHVRLDFDIAITQNGSATKTYRTAVQYQHGAEFDLAPRHAKAIDAQAESRKTRAELAAEGTEASRREAMLREELELFGKIDFAGVDVQDGPEAAQGPATQQEAMLQEELELLGAVDFDARHGFQDDPTARRDAFLQEGMALFGRITSEDGPEAQPPQETQPNQRSIPEIDWGDGGPHPIGLITDDQVVHPMEQLLMVGDRPVGAEQPNPAPGDNSSALDLLVTTVLDLVKDDPLFVHAVNNSMETALGRNELLKLDNELRGKASAFGVNGLVRLLREGLLVKLDDQRHIQLRLARTGPAERIGLERLSGSKQGSQLESGPAEGSTTTVSRSKNINVAGAFITSVLDTTGTVYVIPVVEAGANSSFKQGETSSASTLYKTEHYRALADAFRARFKLEASITENGTELARIDRPLPENVPMTVGYPAEAMGIPPENADYHALAAGVKAPRVPASAQNHIVSVVSWSGGARYRDQVLAAVAGLKDGKGLFGNMAKTLSVDGRLDNYVRGVTAKSNVSWHQVAPRDRSAPVSTRAPKWLDAGFRAVRNFITPGAEHYKATASSDPRLRGFQAVMQTGPENRISAGVTRRDGHSLSHESGSASNAAVGVEARYLHTISKIAQSLKLPVQAGFNLTAKFGHGHRTATFGKFKNFLKQKDFYPSDCVLYRLDFDLHYDASITVDGKPWGEKPASVDDAAAYVWVRKDGVAQFEAQLRDALHGIPHEASLPEPRIEPVEQRLAELTERHGAEPTEQQRGELTEQAKKDLSKVAQDSTLSDLTRFNGAEKIGEQIKTIARGEILKLYRDGELTTRERDAQLAELEDVVGTWDPVKLVDARWRIGIVSVQTEVGVRGRTYAVISKAPTPAAVLDEFAGKLAGQGIPLNDAERADLLTKFEQNYAIRKENAANRGDAVNVAVKVGTDEYQVRSRYSAAEAMSEFEDRFSPRPVTLTDADRARLLQDLTDNQNTLRALGHRKIDAVVEVEGRRYPVRSEKSPQEALGDFERALRKGIGLTERERRDIRQQLRDDERGRKQDRKHDHLTKFELGELEFDVSVTGSPKDVRRATWVDDARISGNRGLEITHGSKIRDTIFGSIAGKVRARFKTFEDGPLQATWVNGFLGGHVEISRGTSSGTSTSATDERKTFYKGPALQIDQDYDFDVSIKVTRKGQPHDAHNVTVPASAQYRVPKFMVENAEHFGAGTVEHIPGHIAAEIYSPELGEAVSPWHGVALTNHGDEIFELLKQHSRELQQRAALKAKAWWGRAEFRVHVPVTGKSFDFRLTRKPRFYTGLDPVLVHSALNSSRLGPQTIATGTRDGILQDRVQSEHVSTTLHRPRMVEIGDAIGAGRLSSAMIEKIGRSLSGGNSAGLDTGLNLTLGGVGADLTGALSWQRDAGTSDAIAGSRKTTFQTGAHEDYVLVVFDEVLTRTAEAQQYMRGRPTHWETLNQYPPAGGSESRTYLRRDGSVWLMTREEAGELIAQSDVPVETTKQEIPELADVGKSLDTSVGLVKMSTDAPFSQWALDVFGKFRHDLVPDSWQDASGHWKALNSPTVRDIKSLDLNAMKRAMLGGGVSFHQEFTDWKGRKHFTELVFEAKPDPDWDKQAAVTELAGGRSFAEHHAVYGDEDEYGASLTVGGQFTYNPLITTEPIKDAVTGPMLSTGYSHTRTDKELATGTSKQYGDRTERKSPNVRVDVPLVFEAKLYTYSEYPALANTVTNGRISSHSYRHPEAREVDLGELATKKGSARLQMPKELLEIRSEGPGELLTGRRLDGETEVTDQVAAATSALVTKQSRDGLLDWAVKVIERTPNSGLGTDTQLKRAFGAASPRRAQLRNWLSDELLRPFGKVLLGDARDVAHIHRGIKAANRALPTGGSATSFIQALRDAEAALGKIKNVAESVAGHAWGETVDTGIAEARAQLLKESEEAQARKDDRTRLREQERELRNVAGQISEHKAQLDLLNRARELADRREALKAEDAVIRATAADRIRADLTKVNQAVKAVGRGYRHTMRVAEKTFATDVEVQLKQRLFNPRVVGETRANRNERMHGEVTTESDSIVRNRSRGNAAAGASTVPTVNPTDSALASPEAGGGGNRRETTHAINANDLQGRTEYGQQDLYLIEFDIEYTLAGKSKLRMHAPALFEESAYQRGGYRITITKEEAQRLGLAESENTTFGDDEHDIDLLKPSLDVNARARALREYGLKLGDLKHFRERVPQLRRKELEDFQNYLAGRGLTVSGTRMGGLAHLGQDGLNHRQKLDVLRHPERYDLRSLVESWQQSTTAGSHSTTDLAHLEQLARDQRSAGTTAHGDDLLANLGQVAEELSKQLEENALASGSDLPRDVGNHRRRFKDDLLAAWANNDKQRMRKAGEAFWRVLTQNTSTEMNTHLANNRAGSSGQAEEGLAGSEPVSSWVVKGKWPAGEVPPVVARAEVIARELHLNYGPEDRGGLLTGPSRAEQHRGNLEKIADVLERAGEAAAREFAEKLRNTPLYEGWQTRVVGGAGGSGSLRDWVRGADWGDLARELKGSKDLRKSVSGDPDARRGLAERLRGVYESDPEQSVRTLAEATGYSHPTVGRLLGEVGAEMRGRAGDPRVVSGLAGRVRGADWGDLARELKGSKGFRGDVLGDPDARRGLAERLKRVYESDPEQSTHTLAEATGYSHRTVRNLLGEVGEEMRGRAGDPRVVSGLAGDVRGADWGDLARELKGSKGFRGDVLADRGARRGLAEWLKRVYESDPTQSTHTLARATGYSDFTVRVLLGEVGAQMRGRAGGPRVVSGLAEQVTDGSGE